MLVPHTMWKNLSLLICARACVCVFMYTYYEHLIIEQAAFLS